MVLPSRAAIAIVGDSKCGKSSLLRQFCEKRFAEKYNPTIGVDYGSKLIKIGHVSVLLSFFDLSGSSDFIHTRNEFYALASGILVVFDVSKIDSLKSLSSWFDEIERYKAESSHMLLCGNKSDKTTKAKSSDIESFCINRGVRYFETSAKNGKNVDKTFQELVNSLK